ASLALPEYGGGELRSLPDAGDVPAHRVERLRLRRLRSGEGAEVELPGLGLLYRIQVLEILAGAKLREGVLRLPLPQLLPLRRLPCRPSPPRAPDRSSRAPPSPDRRSRSGEGKR